jgi:DNA-binding protein YbaB
MSFALTSPKAISALMSTLKNIGSLRTRIAATIVDGKAEGVTISMGCDHAPHAVVLAPEFQAKSAEEQAALVMAAIADAKVKIDEEILKLAGPLGELFVSQANKRG